MADTIVFQSTNMTVGVSGTTSGVTIAATPLTLTVVPDLTDVAVAVQPTNVTVDGSTAGVTVVVASQGPAGATGAGGALGFYGAFSDYTDQTLTSTTVAKVMTFNTTDSANGFTVVSGSRLTCANAGTYNFQWSGQFENTDVADQDVQVWLRLNGVDVTGSTGLVSVPSKHGGTPGHVIASWNYLLNLSANDYIELWWSGSHLGLSLQTYAAGTTPTTPTTASLIATFQQVMFSQAVTDQPLVAAQALGGQRVVVITSAGQADYASNLTASHKWLAIGVTTTAVSAGATVYARVAGLLTEPTWAWTAGAPVYLGTNGLLTQTAPSAPAFLRIIGVATSATSIFIQPQPAIALA